MLSFSVGSLDEDGREPTFWTERNQRNGAAPPQQVHQDISARLHGEGSRQSLQLVDAADGLANAACADEEADKN